uniref:Serpin peptidase inhibitor, clade G (C1 inhibitor), member 1 n=1 Tax=Sinocyclocheilus anshuiensis TaxID=1608454 RepID=A0A671PND1_9TELE
MSVPHWPQRTLIYSIPLTCLPDDAPVLADSTYTWSFTSAHTQQQLTLEEKGKILNLRNIKTTQEGQYKCVQDGYKGEDRVRLRRTFTIRVKAPPPFQEWQVVRVVAGNDVMLPCKKNTVFWKRETEKCDMLLMPDKDTDDQEEDKTPPRVFWDIKEDAGMYHCVITNTTQMLSVELEVEAPPPPRCFGHTDPWEACEDQDSRSVKAILQDSLREFSTSVYADLKGSKPKTNLIFSPISIAVALYNLLLGTHWEWPLPSFIPQHLYCICTNTNTYIVELFLQVGKFPLTGKNSLYILIPRTTSEESFVLMENNINGESIEAMVSEMNTIPSQTAEVILPKIKLTVDTPLEGLLRNLGLSDLFLKPNLCGIFPGEYESFILDVRHRAFLSLTEKGVEAAAATSISFSRSFSSFAALQPFVLILWSDEAGAPLFMGRIINP